MPTGAVDRRPSYRQVQIVDATRERRGDDVRVQHVQRIWRRRLRLDTYAGVFNVIDDRSRDARGR
jgi:hypothetical protein